METIIVNGKKMEGIPYPVAVWDAKNGMWDDSSSDLSEVFANSEDEAIELAYVFEEYTDKGGTGEITLYTDKDEAVRAAEKEWRHLNKSDKRDYRRDVCGTFRVYEVSIPYSDLIGEGEEAYTEYPYTEYEEWEWYNALKED